MKDYAKSINDHYSRIGLEKDILAACESADIDVQALSRDDISSFDEFHIRGRDATRELAQLANLRPGMKVLDLGCGIGGPARTIAAEFGCVVTGVDLVEEYCRTAQVLTERVGLSSKVTFRHGNAMDTPFEESSFDVIWLQHTLMNIEDKARLFEEARRVLVTKGLIALYEVCAGSIFPPHFPVPWASDATISFLATPEDLRDALGRIGFLELVWKDVSKLSLEWFRELIAVMASRPKDSAKTPGLKLLMGSTAAEKSKNLFRNLEEDRISVIQGVLKILKP